MAADSELRYYFSCLMLGDSVGEKQNAVDDRKKVVKIGRWGRLKNLALCFYLCLLKCVSCNIVDMSLAENA